MDSNVENLNVKKIAFINPYLQGKHYHIAESESGNRFVKAANNIGIEAKIFDSSSKLQEFQPDFAVAITYQEAKLSYCPTYLALNTPISLLNKHDRFERNILTYDGIITLSETTKKWYEDLCRRANKTPVIIHGGVTTPQVKYQSIDYKNAKAMYIGTNWDGGRHAAFFNQLKEGDYLKCYGPSDSWKQFHGSLYAGSIPFDGYSVYEAYRMNGIGLCIGHPEFDKYHVLNNRHYEVPAAGALAICSINDTAKQIYGDTLLYINQNNSTDVIIEEFIAQVEWVRHNPSLAKEMAFEANKIYNQQLALESCILEICKKQAELDNQSAVYRYQQNRLDDILTIFNIETESDLSFLKSTLDQSKNALSVWVKCATRHFKLAAEDILKSYTLQKHIVTAEIQGDDLISLFMNQNMFKWFMLREPDVVWATNGLDEMFSTYFQLIQSKKLHAKKFLYPTYYECMPGYHLVDYITDCDKTYDNNTIRIGDIKNTKNIKLGLVVFDIELLKKQTSLTDFGLNQRLRSLLTQASKDAFYYHHVLLAGVNLNRGNVEGVESLGKYAQDDLSQLNQDDLLIYIKELKNEIFNLNMKIESLKPGFMSVMIKRLLTAPFNFKPLFSKGSR